MILRATCLLIVQLLAGEALADSFYMTSNADRLLYRVDDQTGDATPLFDIPARTWTGLSDRPGDPSNLYGVSTATDFTVRLSRFDLALGSVVDYPPITPADIGFNLISLLSALAIDPGQPDIGLSLVQGRIRGVGLVDALLRIDLSTGRPFEAPQLLTNLPSFFQSLRDLEYDPTGSVLHALVDTTGRDQTAFLDPVSGTLEILAAPYPVLTGVSYRSDGQLIGLEGSSDRIFLLDPTTGRDVGVLASTITTSGTISYLVPEPTTGHLLGLGLSLLFAFGSRRGLGCRGAA